MVIFTSIVNWITVQRFYNSPKVGGCQPGCSAVIDGEAIINLKTGRYYSLEGSAAYL
jgi:hypothetical protein